MKPPMPYFGGKQTIASALVSLFPPHEHYVEPFAGGLSVLLAKAPSKMETVNDLDGDLMTFWRVLRDQPEDLIRACALTPHSRTEFLEARDALEVITEYGRHRNALLYVDPPYLGSTRSSRSYAHEMPHEDQHRDLAAALHECKASVVLSGYASALYDDLFADWPVRVELAAATGNGKGYSQRTEVVWANRPLAVAQTFDFEEAS